MSIDISSKYAYVSFWNSSATAVTNLWITNITKHQLTVTATFWNQDGTLRTTGLTYTGFANSDTEIEPGKQAWIQVYDAFSGASKKGYAKVEWANAVNGEEDFLGLMIEASVRADSLYLERSVPVNGGVPF